MRQQYGIYMELSTKQNFACQKNTPVFCATITEFVLV